MDKITMASGKSFDCDFFVVISNPARVYISIVNETIDVIEQVFSNPLETEKITYGDEVVTGYSTIIAITQEDGMVRISLGK